MSKDETRHPPRMDAARTVPRPSDAELLQRMARRDRSAFSLFYQRHERMLFGVALRVAGSRETAEEGFQEAMSRIWLRAGCFDPGGSACGWCVRILVRECLKAKQRTAGPPQYPSERPLDQLPARDGARAGPCRPECQETLSALERLVRRMPSVDRQILALHFSGGLSQAQISKLLVIPQTTVSRRMLRMMRRLREQLGSSGFGAGVSLESWLREALRGRACSWLERARGGMEPVSREGELRRDRGGWSRCRPIPVGLLGLFCLVALPVWMMRTAPEGPGLRIAGDSARATSRVAAAPVGGDVQGEEARPRFRRRWTFERGIPGDLAPLWGRWSHWQERAKGLGPAAVARLYANHAVGIALPVQVPAAPLLLRARIWVPSEYQLTTRDTGSGLQACWRDGEGRLLDSKTLSNRHRYPIHAGQKMDCEIYAFREFVVSRIKESGHISAVSEYGRAYPSDRLLLILHGLALEELSLEEIGVAELPVLLQDPLRLRRKLEVEAPDWGRPLTLFPR